MTKYKEVKVHSSRSIKQYEKEIDGLLARLIKEYDRPHKRPIDTKFINPFFI